MFVPTEALQLILNCKDCHRPVSDSETNAYRLIKGVLYGWCDQCFHDRHSHSTPSAQDNAAGKEQASQALSGSG
jgi:hypothetical protein